MLSALVRVIVALVDRRQPLAFAIDRGDSRWRIVGLDGRSVHHGDVNPSNTCGCDSCDAYRGHRRRC
jgi:hypothetical protein